MSKRANRSTQDIDGIASAVTALAVELREDRQAIRTEIQTDRAENARQITELTGAIREQATQQKQFHESLQEQWKHIDKQRDTIAEVRADSAEMAHSRIWSKQTREAIVQIVYLIIAVAGLLAGPVATYVAFTTGGAIAPVVDRLAALEDRQSNTEQFQSWQTAIFKAQSQLSAMGVSIDWELPSP